MVQYLDLVNVYDSLGEVYLVLVCMDGVCCSYEVVLKIELISISVLVRINSGILFYFVDCFGCCMCGVMVGDVCLYVLKEVDQLFQWIVDVELLYVLGFIGWVVCQWDVGLEYFVQCFVQVIYFDGEIGYCSV